MHLIHVAAWVVKSCILARLRENNAKLAGAQIFYVVVRTLDFSNRLFISTDKRLADVHGGAKI